MKFDHEHRREFRDRRFREATERDGHIFTAADPIEFTKKRINPSISNLQPTMLLEESGIPLALGNIRPEALPNSVYQRAWKIDGLAISRNVEDLGVAAIVLECLLGRARQHSAPIVWCDARPDSLALFRSFGFTTTAGVDAEDGVARMTCRGDGVAEISLARVSKDDIGRVGTLPRLSRAVVFNRMAHIGGLLPNRADVSVAEQTREILEKMDAVLAAAGTNRNRLLSATVWIKDLQHIGEANSVWEAWLPPGAAPARACVQAVPGSTEFAIEIAAVAAV
jgi:enamine deaminase RidA (YjgF/YER057c/UK114 family)